MKKLLVFTVFAFFAFTFWEDYNRPVWDRELRHNFVLSRGFSWESDCDHD